MGVTIHTVTRVIRRWVRLLFGREFPLQDLLVVWDALFADSITLDLVDYIFVAMLLYIRDAYVTPDQTVFYGTVTFTYPVTIMNSNSLVWISRAVISSNYQTCLGLLMHYPPIGDVHSLILRALFLRDPKKNPRPVTYQFQQNLDYYKARGADLMNKTRASAKVAPLNINKVSNSLLNFGRKLIAPAMASGSPAGPAISASSFPSAVMPIRSTVEPLQHQHLQAQQQQQRMMKSESMPVQLSKGFQDHSPGHWESTHWGKKDVLALSAIGGLIPVTMPLNPRRKRESSRTESLQVPSPQSNHVPSSCYYSVVEKELRTVSRHVLGSLVAQHKERQHTCGPNGHGYRSSLISSTGTQTHLQRSTHRDTTQRNIVIAQGDVVTGSEAQMTDPAQNRTALQGQSSKNVSSSPSIESLSAGREYTGSPPLSASKKDFFFSTISRSRSHSKTMGRKESEEELETQISFLQGQLNDLEAMCKYCAKMMNTHLGNIQEVILQEHLEKEDEILVSLAGLKQIKDILKGSLRFNQSQLEAEENEQITIEDDHYCSSSQNKEMGDALKGSVMAKQHFLSTLQATAETSRNAESRSTDDYILDSEEEEGNKGAVSEHKQLLQAHKEAATKNEAPSRSSLVFSDPLMGSISASSSNLSSSPDDDDSNNSKDSDFTIVSPLDI
ncbi:TBC1 domain family member 5 [Chelonia mydas]|uniref:TBC1 domain family member 5 n=1 Tax=Chelonia mydas TaxID=8469 RepID=M7CLB7_CHEMY|nr:TBC1 domain family member 5 [Chelonia mydas]